MGRVVRSLGDEDDSRAYVVMPAFKTFESYAHRVESEMKPVHLKEELFPKTKKCPSCNKECKIKAIKCDYCEFDFEKEYKKKKKKCNFCVIVFSQTHKNPSESKKKEDNRRAVSDNIALLEALAQ